MYTNVAYVHLEPDILPPPGSLPHEHGVVICKPCTVPDKHDQKYRVEVRRRDGNSKALFAHAFQKTSGRNCIAQILAMSNLNTFK